MANGRDVAADSDLRAIFQWIEDHFLNVDGRGMAVYTDRGERYLTIRDILWAFSRHPQFQLDDSSKDMFMRNHQVMGSELINKLERLRQYLLAGKPAIVTEKINEYSPEANAAVEAGLRKKHYREQQAENVKRYQHDTFYQLFRGGASVFNGDDLFDLTTKPGNERLEFVLKKMRDFKVEDGANGVVQCYVIKECDNYNAYLHATLPTNQYHYGRDSVNGKTELTLAAMTTSSEHLLQLQKVTVELEAYVARIKALKNGQKHYRFADGFWFFAKSRGENRHANYRLAKYLLNAIKTDPAFDLANLKDKSYLGQTRAALANNPDLSDSRSHRRATLFATVTNRGINSAELKRVFELR